MSNFVQRTLSGTVYVGLVVASLVLDPAFFGVLFLPVCMLAVREFHHLVSSSRFLTVCGTLAAGVLFVGAWHALCACYPYAGVVIALCAVLYPLIITVALLAELWLKQENPIHNWGYLLSAQVMIALPFALMCFLLSSSACLLLSVFVLIWINDTGAYCVGCTLAKRPGGNHKMFPRVSPGKSWEGLAGGYVFSVAASMLLAHLGWLNVLSAANVNIYVVAAVFAVVVSTFGTLGDLMESVMKRTLGVKDSGRFMPGHGGVLDRFDSILLAVPAVVAMVLVCSLF